METDVWLTPLEIFKALPKFDLDPCAAINAPWPTAKTHYTKVDDGLSLPWFGSVWLNPPYSREAARWLKKLVEHGDGIALVFARTETKMFFKHVWGKASALLFLQGRLTFHTANGQKAKANGGAPSVLIAYGDRCTEWLRKCSLTGAFVSKEGLDLKS